MWFIPCLHEIVLCALYIYVYDYISVYTCVCIYMDMYAVTWTIVLLSSSNIWSKCTGPLNLQLGASDGYLLMSFRGVPFALG